MAMSQLVQHRQIQKIIMSILEQFQTEAALYYRAPNKDLPSRRSSTAASTCAARAEIHGAVLLRPTRNCSIKAKTSPNWIQDKIQQLAAYYVPIESLYPVEQAALIYLIGNGTYDEFVFSPIQMESYKHNWL